MRWKESEDIGCNHLSILFFVSGAGDRHSGLRRGFPCHGWLCGCNESFVWVRCAGLCHICCRSLWINMVSFTFTPPHSFSLLPCFWCFPPSLPNWNEVRVPGFLQELLSSYLSWTLLDLTSFQVLNLKDFPFQNCTCINRNSRETHTHPRIYQDNTPSDGSLCSCVYSPFTCRYMSTLYSHPDFPDRGPKDINKELMNRVSSNPLRLLLPQHITNYIQALWTKKATGQPVTFTDIFGMLIGETLIPSVRAVRYISVCRYSSLFSLSFLSCIVAFVSENYN